MSDLLSGFSSSSKPIKSKAQVNTQKKTFSTMKKTEFIKPESIPQSVSSFESTSKSARIEIDEDDNDDEFAEFDDDAMMFDEELLKKEVDNLSINETLKPNFIKSNKSDPRPDLQSWKNADEGMVDTFNQDTVRTESQNMDIFEKDQHLKMWWYDAYERKEKGYVYIFGKVLNKKTNKYVSCCVTVKNIERNLFFLPRKFELDRKVYCLSLYF